MECTKCGNLRNPGTSSWCNPCRANYEAERRRKLGTPERKKWPDPGDGLKICRSCERVLSLLCFCSSSRGIKGVQAYCDPCHRRRYRDTDLGREQRRKATAGYRKRHRARWLGQNRVNAARYRGLLVSGNVSDIFLRDLYAQENCAYCKRFVLESQRTADHVKALNKGGLHVPENLVMCCLSCNASKQDKDLEEWLTIREK